MDAMRGPAKNRLHDYEAGWLAMLVERGLASEADARAAQSRVANEAVREAEARRERRRSERDARKKRRESGE